MKFNANITVFEELRPEIETIKTSKTNLLEVINEKLKQYSDNTESIHIIIRKEGL